MKKLSLLLTLFGLLACRSPLEATQTIIRIRATPEVEAKIKTVRTKVVALPSNEVASPEQDEAASWPMKRTFVPQNKASSQKFKFSFAALDEAGEPVSQLEITADIVQGATRYLYILVSDNCLVDSCIDGVCRADVKPAALRTSPAQAQVLEGTCGNGELIPAATANTITPGVINNADGSILADGGTGPTQTITGSAAGSVGAAAAAANGGSGGSQSGPDAGTPTKPVVASNDAECAGKPCGQGICSLNSAAPNKYECTCNSGFMRDETESTCVKRNDCLKDNGGCEDVCVPNAIGEAICSCDGQDRWLKGDGKQCAEVQAEQELTTSGGSIDRTRPQVAFDPFGNGVVAWTETTADDMHSLWTARYRADTKQWEKPTRAFQPYSVDAADLHLALDASGSGLLVWTATVNLKRQLWAARYRDAAFALARRVDEGSAGDVLMPSLALDSLGDGLVVWTDAVYPRSSLRVARYLVSSDQFMQMNPLVERDSFVFGTSVAVNSLTSGLIAWTDVPVTTNAEGGVSADFAGSNAFGLRVTETPGGSTAAFEDDSHRSTSPDVVIDAQGRGVAVWLRAMNAEATLLSVVSKVYVPGMGWNTEPLHTLSEQGSRFSAPRVALAADGSVFAAWRESSSVTSPLHSRGAMRTAEGFGPAYELGLPSDPTSWNDIDPAAWTLETTVTALDQLQPSWSTAVGPNQTGFIVGASFDASVTPVTRQLWLQRMSARQEPARLVQFTGSDNVPSRPSALKLGLNANGDGAVVWDRQIDGRYHVFANVLE